MSNQAGNCFKFLCPFQKVRTLPVVYLSILVLKCWSWFGCVRLHTYYLPWLSVMNISRHVYRYVYCKPTQKLNPLSITYYGTQAFLSSLHYYFYAWDASIQGNSISTQLCPSTLVYKFNFQLLSFTVRPWDARFLWNGKTRVAQNSCNLSYLIRQRQENQKNMQLKVFIT
jgi:hypothetical protein